MLNLLKHNITALELTANEVQFDSTIARTERMLQQQSILLETTVMDRTTETATIDVKLTNLAGHKFPSGYPARRAFIELHVQDENGGYALPQRQLGRHLRSGGARRRSTSRTTM
jgi:hypothetical protein